jgi:hypothetical protein
MCLRALAPFPDTFDAPVPHDILPLSRRGGGAAERAGFENRSARKGSGSSNTSRQTAFPASKTNSANNSANKSLTSNIWSRLMLE